jgi:hypothetical protein
VKTFDRPADNVEMLDELLAVYPDPETRPEVIALEVAELHEALDRAWRGEQADPGDRVQAVNNWGVPAWWMQSKSDPTDRAGVTFLHADGTDWWRLRGYRITPFYEDER